jgi:glycosyltransferase involved in cell wall biosynthesis
MNASPKLLIVTTIPETIRAFMLPYACYFRGLGWRVDAMARDLTKNEHLAIHFDKTIDANWSRNPFNPANMFSAARAVRDAVAAESYDIVHVHTPVAAFVTRFALRRRKKTGGPAVVYTAHGFHFYKGGGRRRNFTFRSLERLAGRWTDKLIVINREDFDAAKKYGIVSEENLIYMPGIGLDFSRYDGANTPKADVLQIRDQFGMKNEDVLFSMIAEFNPGKRHRDAVAALSHLAGHNVHLAFAGEGPLKDVTQRLVRSSGLQKRAHFLGRVKDVNPLTLASKATLIPSEREGLSRTGMESACLGTPIIGSDARGVRDIVQPGRGLLFPVGDIFALRDAMQQMCEEPFPEVTPDPAWRIENLIGLHQKLYEELLERRSDVSTKDNGES